MRVLHSAARGYLVAGRLSCPVSLLLCQRACTWPLSRHVALKKWQKNEVFDAVQEAGLSPEEFDWDLDDDESTLRHRPSGAYFVFRGVAGAYVSRYVAGDSPAEERSGLSQYRLMEQVKLWLFNLKQDINTPDLWAQLRARQSCSGPFQMRQLTTRLSPPPSKKRLRGSAKGCATT